MGGNWMILVLSLQKRNWMRSDWTCRLFLAGEWFFLYRDVIASLDLVHEIPWGLKSEYLSSSLGIKVLFEPVSLATFEEMCFDRS
jgi:hypothetical protein